MDWAYEVCGIKNRDKIVIIAINILLIVISLYHILDTVDMTFPDTKLEQKLWNKGFKYVVGIDEAGRGPLAGPVSAGAVIIDSNTEIHPFVRDSKKMSEKQREEVFEYIKENCIAYGISMIEPVIIDELGIQEAVKMAMEDALRQVEKSIGCSANYLIVDGTNVTTITGYHMEKIKAGDLKHYSISAASILAKVSRDRYMKEIAKEYPAYSFEKHVGYGTKIHMDALLKYGPCGIHRRSFAPVRKLLVKSL
jgi:ribonuclease HII